MLGSCVHTKTNSESEINGSKVNKARPPHPTYVGHRWAHFRVWRQKRLTSIKFGARCSLSPRCSHMPPKKKPKKSRKSKKSKPPQSTEDIVVPGTLEEITARLLQVPSAFFCFPVQARLHVFGLHICLRRH